jgi:RNA polymerase sigma factor (sigma-70 family)
MAGDSTAQLQGLIDRLAAGDRSARDELVSRAYDRLRRLAHRMLQGFPDVRALEDSGDVLHDSLPRLTRALEAVPPASVAEFFRLASRQMRWELLDLVQRHSRGGKHPVAGVAGLQSTPREDVPTTTYSPASLAFWTEFHEAVVALPERERDVFELLWYQEVTQAEAAAILHVSESTVRRSWLAARRRLGSLLRDPKDGGASWNS